MGINLSQLKADKIRVTIPLYLADEFIDNIEVYNPTKEQAFEIKVCIQENQVNDGLMLRLLGELTNINIDCEMDDTFYKYYNSMFQNVMSEIESIIFEIATDYAMEINKITNIPEEKVNILNDLIDKSSEIYKNNEIELEQINIEKEKEQIKNECQRQIDEAQIKLNNLQ
jgi:hypothetical protein